MENPVWMTLGLASAVVLAWRAATQRLQLSRSKHRSLAGHARMARRIAAQLPHYEYDEDRFFCADDAPPNVAALRQAGFTRLAELYGQRFAKSAALTSDLRDYLPDLDFTSNYRVPFQFSRKVREALRSGSALEAADGLHLVDLDGNRFYDLAGSYGVNVFGVDFYKQCIERGNHMVAALGPVLGTYHPLMRYNVQRLRDISGLPKVSFHMSGTEAVMQAVRLARYHTGRSHLVRFCGAYHGWWGDVQPGVGNPQTEHHTYTLADLSERSLKVLRTRRDIACVLVNPLQALHPNRNAPGDSALIDSSRSAEFDRHAYSEWLKQLRAVCDERGIALIFDEVFLGFRLAPGGAQEYFGVQADLVTYGKTLGGGLPVGVVCGKAHWMKRYRDDRPADICFARGTFNSHPHVMAAMHVFLQEMEKPERQACYVGLDERWNARAQSLNQRLRNAGAPVQVANLSTIWTILYTTPSRYNWMFQYYLRAQGLALSWVGSGRLIFNFAYDDAAFDDVAQRFMAAATAMQADGWWWSDGATTNQQLRRHVLREMLTERYRAIRSQFFPPR